MFAKFDRREFKVIKSNKLTATIRYMRVCVYLILKQGASQNEMCNNTKWLTYRLTNEWKEEEHKANWRKVDDIDDSLLFFFAVFLSTVWPPINLLLQLDILLQFVFVFT